MRMWFSICSSLDEAQISAGTLRLKSVTSSGRSSTRRIMTWHSGIVLKDAERHVAQEDGLARPRRRDDEAARALADRAEEVDRARRHPAVLHLHLQVLVGETVVRPRSRAGAALLERHPVHRLDEPHLRVREAALRGEGGAADHQPGLQLEAADELLRDEGVGGPALAVLRQVEQLAVAALGHVDVEDALDVDRVVGGAGGGLRAAAGRPGAAGGALAPWG
jgi:hypothetical protein